MALGLLPERWQFPYLVRQCTPLDIVLDLLDAIVEIGTILPIREIGLLHTTVDPAMAIHDLIVVHQGIIALDPAMILHDLLFLRDVLAVGLQAITLIVNHVDRGPYPIHQTLTTAHVTEARAVDPHAISLMTTAGATAHIAQYVDRPCASTPRVCRIDLSLMTAAGVTAHTAQYVDHPGVSTPRVWRIDLPREFMNIPYPRGFMNSPYPLAMSILRGFHIFPSL
jgi:hypothetical protein